MDKFLKEFIITILLTIVIIILLIIALYEYTPNQKNVPTTGEYKRTGQTANTLQEISTATVTTTGNESIIKSYTITASDLKSFAKDKTYDEGRADPFATVGSDLYENETDPNDPTNPGNQTGGGSVNSVGGNKNKTNTSQGYFNSTGKNK